MVTSFSLIFVPEFVNQVTFLHILTDHMAKLGDGVIVKVGALDEVMSHVRS